MSQWSNSESGILRKSRKKDNFEDLLVFGYACKIFRDDDKALHIDQGKHLIPWMGDERIKIDRYDCRGHLSDLTRYEANSEGYDLMRTLDENERKLEQLCDKERYYSLHINEEEEEMYKEEEHKRNQSNEFQYSYDVPMNPKDKEKIPTVPENEEDEKYVPSVDLDVPVDIEIPQTMKEYARIEKTAMFVFTQGPQMEILIKAKQSDNPQFNFLNQNDPLYKFYRHVLNAIKTGRYQTKTTKPAVPNAETSGSESGGHYLHPSLVSSSTSSTDLPLSTIPSLPYRPSANCAYTQLVSRIQSATSTGEGASQSSEPRNELQSEPAGPIFSQINLGNLTYEQQQQYYQYYVQHQYYEYYKHMTQHAAVGDEATSHSKTHMDPSLQSYFQQMMYAQYFQQSQSSQQSTNPYAQIVSNVTKEIPNSCPSLEKPDITKKAVIYGPNQELPNVTLQHVSATDNSTANVGLPSSADKVISAEESPKKPSLLTLIQNYGSDSEQGSSEDEQEEEFNVPEGETKVVIDKMASYVVKNGADFENIVKSRADPRFMFLNKDHEFHKYYQKQVNEENKKKNLIQEVKEVETESKDKPKVINNKLKEKKIIAPVSFSIKKSKEEPPKEIKSALPIDEETDDEEEQSEQDIVPPPPMISQPQTLVSSNACKIVHRTEVSSVAKEKDIPNESEVEEETDVEEIHKSENLHTEKNDAKIIGDERYDERNQLNDTDSNKTTNRLKSNGTLDKDDPILEMIDLTEDMLDEINGDNKDEDIFDLKSDKEKPTKDNRALQLERRRKAMAFLKMKSSTSNTSTLKVLDGAKPTIPIIDLSNIRSPRTKRTSSDSLDDEEDEKHRKRSRSRTKEENFVGEYKSKSRKGCEKSSSKKERSRKSRHLWIDKKYDSNNMSELEEGEMVDDKDEVKYKVSHKKKKTHKRKRSKSKHGSKNKKKSKRKEPKSSSSDSESSTYS
ncbi:hypothetical protein WA026_005253 [Henosepilachna vigintioctopunctata]|uniref:SURP motif domain-containing protein n=1 Tax=Henosepilachna vigintioctopunctata TaxID=420089 RepID=A0AAW1UU48_9CUCU